MVSYVLTIYYYFSYDCTFNFNLSLVNKYDDIMIRSHVYNCRKIAISAYLIASYYSYNLLMRMFCYFITKYTQAN